MPRIDAPTVAQHRAQVLERLVDAAEAILRGDSPERLTAAAVSSAAGIARNSIYRYVDSVDDLQGLVLARHLPAWTTKVDAELAGVTDPAERIVTWVAANLAQAANSGHGWLMGLGRSAPNSLTTSEAMEAAHSTMREVLAEAWSALLGDHNAVRVAAGLTRGLLDAGFRLLDQGVEPDLVIVTATDGVRGLVAALARGDQLLTRPSAPATTLTRRAPDPEHHG